MMGAFPKHHRRGNPNRNLSTAMSSSPFANSCPNPAAPRTSHEQDSDQSLAAHRVLLVAGDKAFLERNASALRQAGCCVHSEDNAEQAWTTLGQHGYSLLVIDHNLPGRSGLRLAVRMRRAKLTVPVILVSEAPVPLKPREHQQLSTVTVLPRPFEDEHLHEMVLASLRHTQRDVCAQRILALAEGGPNSSRQADHKAFVQHEAKADAEPSSQLPQPVAAPSDLLPTSW